MTIARPLPAEVAGRGPLNQGWPIEDHRPIPPVCTSRGGPVRTIDQSHLSVLPGVSRGVARPARHAHVPCHVPTCVNSSVLWWRA